MKQISQNYKTGAIRLEDVRAPALRAGGVLVKTFYSVISSGTEGMKVREGKLSYLGKARARPDQVRKVLNTIQQQGLVATYQKVMNKLDSLTPLGYSLAGEVIEVGTGAEVFHVGQKVACAGAGYANHAEINFVPRNLVVPVPGGVSMKHAAFATVGSIALHGFRQSQIQLGETVCVIGLGLLGQLLVQILRASGVRVVGVDLVEDRCRLAERLGATTALTADDPKLDKAIGRLTGGIGVDCVFISAGGTSNQPVELAIQIARDRARIVDIGKTRLNLEWNDFYMKEVDIRFARSYGPGRYDPTYEEQGIDYPIGYVRWTENRNLASFLDLIADERIMLDPIISSIRPFSDAVQVYEELAEGKGDLLGTLFEFPPGAEITPAKVPETKTVISAAKTHNTVRLGVIGAGNYASSMLLPHLRRIGDVELVAVATTTSLSSENARRKFGFKYATTDCKEILSSPDIDAVIIATRHSSHAQLVCESLRQGKTTYVEKPLALTLDELESIRMAVSESGNDRLMVGFNRRFSTMITQMAEQFTIGAIPVVLHYRVHAGQLDQKSWYLDQSEGSRFVGEAGHFFDVMGYIAGSRAKSVTATTLRPLNPISDDLENIVATVQYENGSVGNLLYLTQGGTKIPKEFIEVFGGGQAAQLHNFESLIFYPQSERRKVGQGRVDKGQKNEMEAFVNAVKTASPMPISVDSLFDTTLTTLASIRSIQTRLPIDLVDYWVAN